MTSKEMLQTTHTILGLLEILRERESRLWRFFFLADWLKRWDFSSFVFRLLDLALAHPASFSSPSIPFYCIRVFYWTGQEAAVLVYHFGHQVPRLFNRLDSSYSTLRPTSNLQNPPHTKFIKDSEA